MSEIRFRASLPPIKSAMLLDGQGDGGQIKLEVPRTEADALLLVFHDYAGKSFWVTIGPLINSGDQHGICEGAEREPEGETAEESSANRDTRTRWIEDKRS